jgi:hypothetical protein
MGITADFSGAIKKMNSALCIPKAVKLQATRWASETVLDLKRSASGMRKGYAMGHGKSSQLSRSVSMRVQTETGRHVIAVGTGLNTVDVKYARIQDQGGDIRPKGHPFLTIPMPGVTGKARDYKDSFLAVSAAGQWMIAQSTGKTKRGLKVLFLLRRKVTLPASRWFTSVIERREPILHEYLDPEVVYNIASQMRGGNG